MKKSPQAFRTISEVAKVLDVPAHVLRFWESRFTQIKPVKRGGGRRYYRPEDVDLIRGIRNLLYVEGLTIKGAQKILRDKGVKHVVAIGRGEDAQIAEADALWDEPGVSDMARSSAAAAPIHSAPAPTAAKKPAPAKQFDPRQTSLFGDDDLAKNIAEDVVADLVETAEPDQVELRKDAPEAAKTLRPAAETPVADPGPAFAPDQQAKEQQDGDDGLDQDALRAVFGKLKALRASMEDD